jgi:hypothetical protein
MVPTVSGKQVLRLDRRHLPIVLGQLVGHVGALLQKPQILRIRRLFADGIVVAAQPFPATSHVLRIEEAAPKSLGSHAATRCAELRDPLEKQIPVGGRQVRQQPFGRPRRGYQRVDTMLSQRFWPVLTPADRHRPIRGGRSRTVRRQEVRLEL